MPKSVILCPQAVQPHMSKCFDGVRRLEFGENGGEVAGLVGNEGERMALHPPVKTRGGSEAWLAATETAMVGALRKLAQNAVHSLSPQACSFQSLSTERQAMACHTETHYNHTLNECYQKTKCRVPRKKPNMKVDAQEMDGDS